MTKPETLYGIYKNNPKINNKEIAELTGWGDMDTKVQKYRLKKRGFIAVFEGEVLILKPYKELEENEKSDFKKEAYRELFTACIERLRENNCSTAQFISLMQESRLILKEI